MRHALRDRIRMTIPRIRKNLPKARLLEKQASEMDGIYWARCNTNCASVVVRFDSSRHTTQHIIDVMTQLAE